MCENPWAATHSRASQETTSLAAGSLELQTPHPLDLRDDPLRKKSKWIQMDQHYDLTG
jgi:hypothetical protein